MQIYYDHHLMCSLILIPQYDSNSTLEYELQYLVVLQSSNPLLIPEKKSFVNCFICLTTNPSKINPKSLVELYVVGISWFDREVNSIMQDIVHILDEAAPRIKQKLDRAWWIMINKTKGTYTFHVSLGRLFLSSFHIKKAKFKSPNFQDDKNVRLIAEPRDFTWSRCYQTLERDIKYQLAFFPWHPKISPSSC